MKKCCFVKIALLSFVALTFAAPLFYTIDTNALSQSSLDDVEQFDAKEWSVLERRDGEFANTNKGQREGAMAIIDDAKETGRLADAASQGSVRSMKDNDSFHIDRQTAPNQGKGHHKVAVQLNRGKPSTIGLVVIYPHYKPSDALVAKRLKHSIEIGRETHALPGDRKIKNIANNERAQREKAARMEAKRAAGNRKATEGTYRKGNKEIIEAREGR